MAKNQHVRLDEVVGLGNPTVLIARDGTERPIDDSAAPIKDATGSTAGVVLVFRDVSRGMRGKPVVELLSSRGGIASGGWQAGRDRRTLG